MQISMKEFHSMGLERCSSMARFFSLKMIRSTASLWAVYLAVYSGNSSIPMMIFSRMLW
jgi:hypothetical protein